MTYVYKAGQNSVITLELCDDSITNEDRDGVVDSDHAKFRTNKATVVDITNPVTNKKLESDMSIYDENFVYEMNKVVKVSDYDGDKNEVCATGIHYFKTRETSLNWFYFENNDRYGHPDGIHKIWYENGRMWHEQNYKDGIENGIHKIWYENGQLRIENNYKDGKKNGVEKNWRKNGQLQYKENYKNGKWDGIQKAWWENGQLQCIENYKNGERDGVKKIWLENGQRWNRNEIE